MKKEDVIHLAKLARLELTPDEIEKYTKEIGDILGYVDQIKDVAGEEGRIESAGVRNVFREDDDAMESGKYTDALIKEAPDHKKNYVKVQKILNNDSDA